MEAESYVVRIYRRAGRSSSRGGHAVAGIVENAETGERHGFRSAEQLWALLRPPVPSRRRTERAQRKERG